MADTLPSDLLTFHPSRSVIISALGDNANFRVTVVKRKVFALKSKTKEIMTSWDIKLT